MLIGYGLEWLGELRNADWIWLGKLRNSDLHPPSATESSMLNETVHPSRAFRFGQPRSKVGATLAFWHRFRAARHIQ